MGHWGHVDNFCRDKTERRRWHRPTSRDRDVEIETTTWHHFTDVAT